MKSKTLILTLEITVSDLSAAELKENARIGDCTVEDLPGLQDVEALDIAECIEGAIQISEETFSGSNIFVEIKDTRIISADWVT